jgi:hypothetical protein
MSDSPDHTTIRHRLPGLRRVGTDNDDDARLHDTVRSTEDAIHHALGPIVDVEQSLATLKQRLAQDPSPGGETPSVTSVLDHVPALVALVHGPEHLTQPSVRRTVLTVAQAEPERIAGARQQLRELLHDWTSGDQTDSAVLLASEMLTNVLVHTDADALLVAELTGDHGSRRIRVEVTDASDDLPHKRSSGRGLVLIELLADAWGVDPRGEGKSIWFELYELPGEGSPG